MKMNAMVTLLPLVEYLRRDHATISEENRKLKKQLFLKEQQLQEAWDDHVQLIAECESAEEDKGVVEALREHIDSAVLELMEHKADEESAGQIRVLKQKLERKTKDYNDALEALHQARAQTERALRDKKAAEMIAHTHETRAAAETRFIESSRSLAKAKEALAGANGGMAKQLLEEKAQLERDIAELKRHLQAAKQHFDDAPDKSLRAINRALLVLFPESSDREPEDQEPEAEQ